MRLTFLTIQFGGACFTGNILREEGPGLVLKDLSVATPNARNILYRDLSLQLAPGDSLLVMGPSGCGKSSLLRAIAGLWNRGSGILQKSSTRRHLLLAAKAVHAIRVVTRATHFPINFEFFESLKCDS